MYSAAAASTRWRVRELNCPTTYNRAGSSINVATGILFEGKNISFYASLVMYINSTSIPPIMIMNRMYENQNLLYIFPLMKHTTVFCISSISLIAKAVSKPV